MKNKTLVIAFIAIISFAMAGCPSGGAGGGTTGGGGIEMVYVPSGSFQMGDANSNQAVEKPAHEVTLTAFYIGKYEVTQEQYEDVMGSNPSIYNSNPATGEVQGKRPVEIVSWYDAIEFCNALSVKEGLNKYYTIDKATKDPNNMDTSDTLKWTVKVNSGANGYRLPTEAQWEYAAKGGNGTPGNYTYSGSNNVGDVAWYVVNSDDKTHEVGKKNPNGLGIYDMSGNAFEWCWDWYGDYYYSESGNGNNPTGPVSGEKRVLRGGSFYEGNQYVCSVFRFNSFPNSHSDYMGFRLVRP